MKIPCPVRLGGGRNQAALRVSLGRSLGQVEMDGERGKAGRQPSHVLSWASGRQPREGRALAAGGLKVNYGGSYTRSPNRLFPHTPCSGEKHSSSWPW